MEKVLEGSTISVQGPTPDAKLAARVYHIIASCFVEASSIVEKAVLCYKADGLVTSLPSFRSVQLSLAVLYQHIGARTSLAGLAMAGPFSAEVET